MKFCLGHGIEVVNTIQEDHSAKDFNRPGWIAMMSYFKRHRFLCPDLLLFTKWDRFSRNAGDAYYMMTQLKKMNIEPRAIDQALDLSIPENKIILGVYLSASEAENERRSINIKQIHKAKQKGRWPSHAPLGYGYQLTDNGQKKIYPKEPEAIMIRKSFSQIAANKQSVKSVYDEMIQPGLKCSISHFWRIIRNPIYCGKILVPAFENEKAYLVNGQHEAIISESLFNEVLIAVNKYS